MEECLERNDLHPVQLLKLQHIRQHLLDGLLRGVDALHVAVQPYLPVHVDLLELLQHVRLDLEALHRVVQDLQLIRLEEPQDRVVVHQRRDDFARAVLAVIANGAPYPHAFLEHDDRVAVALALGDAVLVVSVVDGAVFDALLIVGVGVEIAVEVFLPSHSLLPAVAAAAVVGLEEVSVVAVLEEVGQHLLQLAVDDQRRLLADELAHILQVLLGIPKSLELFDSDLLHLKVLLCRTLVEDLEVVVLQFGQLAFGKRSPDGQLGKA